VSDTLGIIGAGAFGTALADVVAQQGTTVWIDTADEADARAINETHRHEKRLPGVTLSPRVRATASVAEVAANARLLVFAVSSRRAREVALVLGRAVDGRHAIVHAIGALVEDGQGDDGALVRVSELLRATTGVRRIGVLAGPALSRDLVERRPAALIVASPFDEVVAAVQRLVSAPPSLRIYGSSDLAGAEIASALAGALTVGVGLADGIDVGPGPRALLVTRGMAEGARLVVAAGGEARTMTGLAGLGNVLARSSPGTSDRSDDYQLGLAIGRGTPVASVRASEGSRTAPALLRLAERVGTRLPILRALHLAVGEQLPLPKVIATLLDHHAEEE
jgi:glycerol-3-phosphate dehydrogenase (NAD(P)+)